MKDTMLFDQVIEAMGLPFTIVYAILLLGLLYFLLISIPKTLRIKYWPKINGEIISSELYTGKRTSKGSTYTVYSAKIVYKYTISGSEYTSKKIKWVDHVSTSKSYHLSVLDKYPTGAKVDVLYHPKKPATSVLEAGFSIGNAIALLFFAISIGAMSFLLSTKL